MRMYVTLVSFRNESEIAFTTNLDFLLVMLQQQNETSKKDAQIGRIYIEKDTGTSKFSDGSFHV